MLGRGCPAVLCPAREDAPAFYGCCENKRAGLLGAGGHVPSARGPESEGRYHRLPFRRFSSVLRRCGLRRLGPAGPLERRRPAVGPVVQEDHAGTDRSWAGPLRRAGGLVDLLGPDRRDHAGGGGGGVRGGGQWDGAVPEPADKTGGGLRLCGGQAGHPHRGLRLPGAGGGHLRGPVHGGLAHRPGGGGGPHPTTTCAGGPTSSAAMGSPTRCPWRPTCRSGTGI